MLGPRNKEGSRVVLTSTEEGRSGWDWRVCVAGGVLLRPCARRGRAQAGCCACSLQPRARALARVARVTPDAQRWTPLFPGHRAAPPEASCCGRAGVGMETCAEPGRSPGRRGREGSRALAVPKEFPRGSLCWAAGRGGRGPRTARAKSREWDRRPSGGFSPGKSYAAASLSLGFSRELSGGLPPSRCAGGERPLAPPVSELSFKRVFFFF